MIRMIRHWNDGKDKFIVLNKHVYLKWLLSFLMTILTCMHIIDLALFINLETLDLISRSFFFSLLLLSWLTSFILGIFENNKRLIMRWSGHRSFWPANILVHLILMIQDGLIIFDDDPPIHWVFVLEFIYFSEILFCSILTVYAFKRPNEFLIIGEFDISFLRRQTRRTLAGSTSLQDSGECPKISIKNYKIKQEEGKTVICFTITTVFNSVPYVAKRNLQEFDSLNRHVVKSFPVSEYPNFNIPSFPNVFGKDNEEKIVVLGEYLNSLASPEFFSEFFLDFLGINGVNKTNLLKKNEIILRNEESVEKNQFRSDSIAERYFNPSLLNAETLEDQPTQNCCEYIEIKILRWLEVEEHIEYEISFNLKSENNPKSTLKRYKDILEFHKNLAKLVSPAKLPEFPSKNYLKKLTKIDEKALNLRKDNLELYLNHVYNDVAFICTESLEFLGISTSLTAIWQVPYINYNIKLAGPLICSPIIDDLGHYILYTIKLAKFQDKQKKCEWEITKRYRQFDTLHHFLNKRVQSPILNKYHEFRGIKDVNLPSLPGKSVGVLISSEEIEARRLGLEKYLEEILAVPGNLQSYILKQFIQDPSNENFYKIN